MQKQFTFDYCMPQSQRPSNIERLLYKSPSLFDDKSRNCAKPVFTRHSSIASIGRHISPLRAVGNEVVQGCSKSKSPIRVREPRYYNPFTLELRSKAIVNMRCLAQYKSKIGPPGNITLIRLIKS